MAHTPLTPTHWNCRSEEALVSPSRRNPTNWVCHLRLLSLGSRRPTSCPALSTCGVRRGQASASPRVSPIATPVVNRPIIPTTIASCSAFVTMSDAWRGVSKQFCYECRVAGIRSDRYIEMIGTRGEQPSLGSPTDPQSAVGDSSSGEQFSPTVFDNCLRFRLTQTANTPTGRRRCAGSGRRWQRPGGRHPARESRAGSGDSPVDSATPHPGRAHGRAGAGRP